MSSYLLDTHVAIWALAEPGRLLPDIARLLDSREDRFLISIATFWETAIKVERGRMIAPDNFPVAAAALGLEVLPITAEHAWAVRRLPREHGDPFDRLIVAQAIAEDLVLITHDRKLVEYGCKVLLA